MFARRSLPTAARDPILDWYAERGRPLAFRRTTDPYAILVAETMAQQTQASRAAEYWERFMTRFPTVDELAMATPADVLRAWQGLGYDRRAIALWRTARVLVTEHGGRVPTSIEALQRLPGVGPYTARAVAAIAFGVPVGAVDVNVRRVLGRILAGGAEGFSTGDMQLIADAAVPADRAGAWTHAVMDVGATVCRPRAPRCEECPARAWCRYAAGDRPDVRASSIVRKRADRDPAKPFTTTNRWLRGRILDRLRTAPDGDWVPLDEPIGSHELARVRAAATSMAVDGVLELDRAAGAALRARLPLA